MKSVAVLLVAAIAAIAVTAVAAASVQYNSGLVNTKVLRSINLQTQIEENVYQYDIQNSGSSDADYYLVAISASKAERLSFINARLISDKSKGSSDDDEDDDADDIKAKAGISLKSTQVTVTGSDVRTSSLLSFVPSESRSLTPQFLFLLVVGFRHRLALCSIKSSSRNRSRPKRLLRS